MGRLCPQEIIPPDLMLTKAAPTPTTVVHSPMYLHAVSGTWCDLMARLFLKFSGFSHTKGAAQSVYTSTTHALELMGTSRCHSPVLFVCVFLRAYSVAQPSQESLGSPQNDIACMRINVDRPASHSFFVVCIRAPPSTPIRFPSAKSRRTTSETSSIYNQFRIHDTSLFAVVSRRIPSAKL